jgi:hypothetical protein
VDVVGGVNLSLNVYVVTAKKLPPPLTDKLPCLLDYNCLIVCLLFANASSDIANGDMINANAITAALHGRTVFVFGCILFRIRYRYKVY